jgi:hypothetical protein
VEILVKGVITKKESNMKETFYKWITTIIVTVIAFLPTIFWFLVKNMLNPEGFWQNFVVFGVGIYFLGFLQLVLIGIYIGVLIEVIWN